MTQDDLDLSHALYSASSRAFREDQDYPEAIAHRLARDHEEALRVWQAFSDRVTKAIRVKLLGKLAQETQDAGGYPELDKVMGPWKREEP